MYLFFGIHFKYNRNYINLMIKYFLLNAKINQIKFFVYNNLYKSVFNKTKKKNYDKT